MEKKVFKAMKHKLRGGFNRIMSRSVIEEKRLRCGGCRENLVRVIKNTGEDKDEK